MEVKNNGESRPILTTHGVHKLESLTIGELNEFVLKGAPQAIDFLCTTKVTDIQTKNGWRYISCSKCSKKLLKGASSFTCTKCHDPNAVGVVRYRVELVVTDNNNSAVFTAFDTDITKLTNVRAADVGDIGGEYDVGEDIPHLLKSIVGKTYTFQLKLTEYNFTSKHQSFTISRIFSVPDIVPEPTFVTEVNNEELDSNKGAVTSSHEGKITKKARTK